MFPDDVKRCRFGVFDFDPRGLELCKNGRVVRVRPQSLKVLSLLLARAGELVSRDEIQQAVWGHGTFVDYEQGVNHCIRELRTALGDIAESPRYIQTLPRRGYRFIAPIDIETPSATLVQAAAVAASPAPARRARALAVAALAVVLAGLAIAPYAARFTGDPPAAPSSLTVLPFSAPGGDPAFGIGLANAISQRLGGQQAVSIHPGRGSVALDGEVATNGASVAVVARLKDGVSGDTIWSEQFTVRSDELFSIEDVVAERVVAALDLRLAAAEQERLRRRYTSNTAAYQKYLRGRAAIVKYTEEGTRQAIGAFEAALQQDGQYALARAGLAMACADMYLRFARAGDVEAWGTRAEAEARAALELDPDLAEAHLARAAVARKREFDWAATLSASRRAIVLNPNLADARFFIAAAYYHHGYMEEALIEMAKGRAIPGSNAVEAIRIEALVALFSGKFAPARAHLEEVSRRSSQPIGDTYLALAHYYTGNVQRGRAMLEALASNRSASTAARSAAALAGVLAAEGDAAGARRRIEDVLARDYRDHHVSYSIGAAYAQLAEVDEAVRWLRTAADTGFPCLIWLERDPLLEPIRLHADFQALKTHVRATRESSLSHVD